VKVGGEFMPPLDEGDVLYMPSALPGLSAGKASQLDAAADRLLMTIPEGGSRVRKNGFERTRPRILRRSRCPKLPCNLSRTISGGRE